MEKKVELICFFKSSNLVANSLLSKRMRGEVINQTRNFLDAPLSPAVLGGLYPPSIRGEGGIIRKLC